MEPNVRKRFFQKLEALEDRLTFIGDHFAPIDEFEENRLLRKALYKGGSETFTHKDSGMIVLDTAMMEVVRHGNV